MDSVRVGVIGIGSMGACHASYLNRGDVPGATLAAVCDVNPERLAWARQNLAPTVQGFATADALVAAGVVDAVLIATPHYLHPPLGIQAFQAGLHVLTEKPAGVYTRQVRELNAAAARAGKVFGIMFNQRTLGVHQKMRQFVQGGELGALQRVNWIVTDWFRCQSYYDAGGWRATWAGEGGGVLLNQCPHNLDLLQWICGMPGRVRAHCGFGKYHRIEVEDEVTAWFEYANGATGVFITTTGEAPGTNRFEIVGDRGKLVLEHGTLQFWQTRQSVSQFRNESPNGFAMPETWKCDVPCAAGGDQHVGITRNWVQGIRQGTPLLAPGDEGINGLQLSNAMFLSAWTDRTVEIPVDEERFYAALQERIQHSQTAKDPQVSRTLTVDGTFGATR